MDTGLRAPRHRFELGGGAVAKRRMSADSGIQDVDPVEHVLPGFFTGPIPLRLYVFRFPRMKEPFHNRIVPAVPAPTPARRQTVSGQHPRYRVAADGAPRSVGCSPPGAGRRWVTAMVSAAIANA